jgi:hypothetical protein
MSVDLPAAEVAHAMPGRTRLRLPDHRGDAAFFASVTSGLLSLPGVFDVETRPLTGSVLIAHLNPLEELGDAARTAGLFNLRSAPVPPSLDPKVEFDPKLIFALALAGLAIWQISREKVVPPALTLLWYASNLGGLWRHNGMADGE